MDGRTTHNWECGAHCALAAKERKTEEETNSDPHRLRRRNRLNSLPPSYKTLPCLAPPLLLLLSNLNSIHHHQISSSPSKQHNTNTYGGETPRRRSLLNPHRIIIHMGELATSPAVLPVVFVDGDQSVDLGTVTLQPSLGVKKLQAVVADRVGLAPNQISASLARPRRARRVPLDEATDLAAAVAREGSGCYVQAALRRSRRGGRSRRDKKHGAAAAPKPQQPEKTILKRLPPTDLASLAAAPVMFGAWDYEAQLRELQLQRDWYLMNTQAAPDPYFPLAPDLEDPLLWTPRRPSRCHECEAAAAAMREPAFHWCVRDAVTVGFRSPVGPIERPAKKSPSPPPASPGLVY